MANGLIGADPETPQRGRRNLQPFVNRYKPYVPLERRTDKAAHMPTRSGVRTAVLRISPH